MTSRTTTITATGLTALAIAAALTACAPTPEPTPTPTGFASEAEAFAAAEATYRAYVDATNAARADPSHSPSPESFLRGELLESELEFVRDLAQAGLEVRGDTSIASVEHLRTTASLAEAKIAICLDSSKTVLVDSGGVDVTPADRATLALIYATVTWTPSGSVITESETAGVGQC